MAHRALIHPAATSLGRAASQPNGIASYSLTCIDGIGLCCVRSRAVWSATARLTLQLHRPRRLSHTAFWQTRKCAEESDHSQLIMLTVVDSIKSSFNAFPCWGISAERGMHVDLAIDALCSCHQGHGSAMHLGATYLFTWCCLLAREE